jgi:hypothetical protein
LALNILFIAAAKLTSDVAIQTDNIDAAGVGVTVLRIKLTPSKNKTDETNGHLEIPEPVLML